MEKLYGGRYCQFLQTIEKVCSSKNDKKDIVEDLPQLRYATSKILQAIITPGTFDYNCQDVFLKRNAHITLLEAIQEVSLDKTVLENIVSILNELISRPCNSKYVTSLVNNGASHILLQLLVVESKANHPSEHFMIQIHQLLAKIGHKDRKFAIKARLNQALTPTLGLIKTNIGNFRNLQPLLQVFQLYAANSVNSSYLGKHNCIAYLFRVISSGRNHVVVFKLALEILISLTKSKSNSSKTVALGGVQTLLNFHIEWHSFDSKHRSMPIRRSILKILKNLINLKSGKDAFLAANGLQILYDTSHDCVDCREMEAYVLLSTLIMRKCCPKNDLPIPSLDNPVSFFCPGWENHMADQVIKTYEKEHPESDSSSMDDYDAADIDVDRIRSENSEELQLNGNIGDLPCIRTAEDIAINEKFFPELKFQCLFKNPSTNEKDVDPPFWLVPCLEIKKEQKATCHPSIDKYPAGSNLKYSEKTSLHSLPSLSTRMADIEQMPMTHIQRSHTSSFFINMENRLFQKSASVKSCKKQKSGKKNKEKKPKRNKTESDLSDLLRISSLMSVGHSLNHLDNALFISNMDEWMVDAHYSGLYISMAKETKSIMQFQKVAYPDLCGATCFPYPEALHGKKYGLPKPNFSFCKNKKWLTRSHKCSCFYGKVCEKCMRMECLLRQKIFEDIDRFINPNSIIEKVVYDLDDLVSMQELSGTATTNPFADNDDEFWLLHDEGSGGPLQFNSLFESGNLRRVIQMREYEYDLILNPDVNTNHHHQWFYFELRNMVSNVPYRFNIINCEKSNSQFNVGMKPLMFSVREAIEGRPNWFRTGSDICYYRNHFSRSYKATESGAKGKSYYTATFMLTFPHCSDICYLAYHYPYTYSTLKTHLALWGKKSSSMELFFDHQTLCESSSGNPVSVVTITAKPDLVPDAASADFIGNKPYIFLSARVHPGESNSSWIMKGVIDFLLSQNDIAESLREMYVFKIIPMLNPDGVINGNHRCSLAAEDLNRHWSFPNANLHPTIFHTKGLLLYLKKIDKIPIVFCDFHGHSRRKNVFMYGCSPLTSWKADDTDNPVHNENGKEDLSYKQLPRILHQIAPAFSIQNTNYLVEEAKESTARVVVWRQIGVVKSYCMESTFCGCDHGRYKNQHISTRILQEMGAKFCESLLALGSMSTSVDVSLSSNTANSDAGSDMDFQGINQDIASASGGSVVDDTSSILTDGFAKFNPSNKPADEIDGVVQ